MIRVLLIMQSCVNNLDQNNQNNQGNNEDRDRLLREQREREEKLREEERQRIEQLERERQEREQVNFTECCRYPSVHCKHFVICNDKLTVYTVALVDRCKNSSRIDVISHKIGDRKHQYLRKDLGGSNLLSR